MDLNTGTKYYIFNTNGDILMTEMKTLFSKLKYCLEIVDTSEINPSVKTFNMEVVMPSLPLHSNIPMDVTYANHYLHYTVK